MESERTAEMDAVIESLKNMFSGIVSEDVIFTVVESCGGDLNLSVDTIMRITNDGNDNDNVGEAHKGDEQSEQYEPEPVQNNENEATPVPNFNPHVNQSLSYAAAFNSNTGTVPKQRIKPITSSPEAGWNDQIRRIISNHSNGSRILIIMRGAPGSGKSHLAKKIIEMTIGSTFADFKTHILSTDDYFMSRGQYRYNRTNLPEAHQWNQERAQAAMEQGLSPIIIDNTNISMWEIEPYARKGVACGYILEVVEPNTPWAKKPNQLARRNIHNVPLPTIKKMLDNYINGITAESILNFYGLSYPSDKVPPVLRTMPAVEHRFDAESSGNPDIPISHKQSQNVENINEGLKENMSNLEVRKLCGDTSKSVQRVHGPENTTKIQEKDKGEISVETVSNLKSMTETTESSNLNIEIREIGTNYDMETSENTIEPKKRPDTQEMTKEVENNEFRNLDLYLQVQKQLEEIEKVEQEWEHGENWDDNCQESVNLNEEATSSLAVPKPPRNNILSHSERSNSKDNFLGSVKNYDDWRQISMFMPPWQDLPTVQNMSSDIPVEKMSSGTCMEIGDMDIKNNMFKILTATPRDINELHISFSREKIPEKRMLDKSTMTNKNSPIDTPVRCKNEEKHFREFRKLFKNISQKALREIFDNCLGDVNWAVDIVLDGVASKHLATIDQVEMSDDDDSANVNDEQCTCLAAYNILPDATPEPEMVSEPKNLLSPSVTDSVPQIQKKSKKENNNVSEDSLILKRLIEQNVDFSERHYSEHCLKIRKFRRGEHEFGEEIQQISNQSEIDTNQDQPVLQEPQGSMQDSASCLPDSANTNENNEGDDDEWIADDVEKTVNIHFGREFICELDALFGRKDMTYPDNVVPRINIPLSMLNELNALWMESLMHQLDELDKQSAIMLNEDEEFARQLAMKEAELAQAGKEPEVPDFKEIMDLDLALSLYQKDVAEWRNKEPNDLAAKLTRDKLYNLFPDVPKEVLSELLMAHDNNFQSTVEVLLMSTGKADLLTEKNGVNKFVMAKEMERKKQILELEKKALSEEEWPMLREDGPVEMEQVQQYRNQASQHLARRQYNHDKANEYIRRGMLEMAQFYGSVAEFHKIKYEQANSMAAASLMQVHASRNNNFVTIDLHYLRVREALEAMDLFIDVHIQRLKEIRRPIGLTLFFITGRGLHSNGKPRIKPAVRRRLIARGLRSIERNPGLLTSRVCALSKLTHEVELA